MTRIVTVNLRHTYETSDNPSVYESRDVGTTAAIESGMKTNYLSHCLYCPETDEFSIEAPLEDCLAEANRRNAGIRRDDPTPSWIVVPQESRMLGSVEAIVATEVKKRAS